MSGYTPLFSSLTTGTLCGKWPDIGLWPIILSMSDKNGVVDVTTQYISSVTGLPHQDVLDCMQRFCEPDKYSRSDAESGARLVLLEEHRPWGWRIVNHSKYREKARKQSSDAARVESGQNRERMAKRAETREDPRQPAETRADRLSDSDANTNSKRGAKRAAALAEARATPGLDLEAWDRWLAYRSERKPAIASCSAKEAALELAGFGEDQAAVVKQSIAKQWQGLFALKINGKSRLEEPPAQPAPRRFGQ